MLPVLLLLLMYNLFANLKLLCVYFLKIIKKKNHFDLFIKYPTSAKFFFEYFSSWVTLHIIPTKLINMNLKFIIDIRLIEAKGFASNFHEASTKLCCP
jgi:hypothetical protein